MKGFQRLCQIKTCSVCDTCTAVYYNSMGEVLTNCNDNKVVTDTGTATMIASRQGSGDSNRDTATATTVNNDSNDDAAATAATRSGSDGTTIVPKYIFFSFDHC